MMLLFSSVSLWGLQAQTIDPTICNPEENLTAYGDFEDFPTVSFPYISNFVAPYNQEWIQVRNAQGNSTPNNVYVFNDSGNKYVRFSRCNNTCDQKNVIMPLCEPVEVGCAVRVEFEACADNSANGGRPATLGVWALNQAPSPNLLDYFEECDGLLLDASSNVIGFCLGEVTVGHCPGAPSPSDYFDLAEEVPASVGDVTHIWFFGTNPQDHVTQYTLDNVVTTKECREVECNPGLLEACICDQAVFNLGLENTGTTVDVTVQPLLQSFPDLSMSPYNPDFPNGVATINEMMHGESVFLSLYLDIDCEVEHGTEFNVPLQVVVYGQIGTDTLTVNLNFIAEDCPCECPDGALSIGSHGMDTYLSDLINSNVLPQFPSTPLNLNVKGNLIIDGLYYGFPTGSEICMDSAAAIKVTATTGGTGFLQAYGVHFFGECLRWEGISVDPKCALILFDSHVEDAQYAVYAGNYSTIRITDSELHRNYVGLRFNAPDEFSLYQFYGNKFHSTKPLKPHYDPLDPNDGPWSYAGLHIENQPVLEIGQLNPFLTENHFDYLRNGIITENCHVHIENTRFSHIYQQDYPLSGFGIHATGTGQLFEQPGNCNDAGSVWFDKTHTGIYLQNMDAQILNNQMTEMNRGIVVAQGANRDIVICGNTIEASRMGIGLLQNDPANQILVQYNEIDLKTPPGAPKSYAIRVAEGGSLQTNAKIQHNNSISIQGADAGISLANANGYEVRQNTIHAIGQGVVYSGMELSNSPNNQIGCNQITGDHVAGTTGLTAMPAGIRARASHSVQYDCNDVHSTYVGVQFDMPCNNSKLRTTNFENHRYGLYYTSMAQVGDQPAAPGIEPMHGNRWNGTWGGSTAIGAWHESSLFMNSNRYYVPNVAAPTGPQNPDPAAGWFFQFSGAELECESTCELPGGGGNEEMFISELDEQVASGAYNPESYIESMRWMMERDLYRRLYHYPELQTQGGMNSFYASNSTTDIGQLIEVEAGAAGLYALAPEVQASLETLRVGILEKLAEIRGLHHNLLEAEPSDSLQLMEQLEQLQEQLSELNLEHYTLNQAVLEARAEAANGLLLVNDAISTGGLCAQNEQVVNAIFLSSYAQGHWPNEAQVALLSDIAAQCPYSSGTAVFRARALLSGLVEDTFDDSACDPEVEALSMPNEGQVPLVQAARLFPNPATNQFTLQLAEATQVPSQLDVYNMYGQRVQTVILPAGLTEQVVSTAELAPGVYWVRVHDREAELFSSKLILAK